MTENIIDDEKGPSPMLPSTDSSQPVQDNVKDGKVDMEVELQQVDTSGDDDVKAPDALNTIQSEATGLKETEGTLEESTPVSIKPEATGNKEKDDTVMLEESPPGDITTLTSSSSRPNSLMDINSRPSSSGSVNSRPDTSGSAHGRPTAAAFEKMNALGKLLMEIEQEDELDAEDEVLDELEDQVQELKAVRAPTFAWKDSVHARYVQQTKLEMEKSVVGSQRLIQFDQEASQLQLKVGSMSKEEAKRRYEELKAKRFADKQFIKTHFIKELENVANREQQARRRVLEMHLKRKESLKLMKRQVISSIESSQPRLRRAFRSREEGFKEALLKQNVDIKEKYGIVQKDYSYEERELIVKTDRRVPQELVISVIKARGVKDKIPRGRFSIVAYILDELGGARIQFTKSNQGDRPITTKAVKHIGRFSDFEMKIEDEIELVCPSAIEVKPSQAIVLELYQIDDDGDFERSLGFTAVPLLSSDQRLLHGKYRLPMVRGPYSSRYDRFYKIEKSYAKNLDNWLCNLYVEMRPRKTEFQKQTGRTDMDFAKEVQQIVPTGGPYTKPTSLVSRLKRRIVGDHAKIEPGTAKTMADSKPIQPLDHIDKSGMVQFSRSDTVDDDQGFVQDKFEYAIERNPKAQHASALQHLGYVKQELIGSFARTRWYSNEPWLMAVVIFLAFWMRMYVHFMGKFLYLQGGYAAVIDFRVLLHRCVLKYSLTSVPLSSHVGLAIMGTFSCLLVFVALAMLNWFIHRTTSHLPALFSKFVLVFGVLTALDPLLIILVDALAGNFSCSEKCGLNLYKQSCLCSETDVVRIVNYFLQYEGSIMNAIYVIALVYILLISTCTVSLLVYVIFVCKNGRSHDLYRRLNFTEEYFFLPFDNEVTPKYVALARHRAKQWEGPKGESRHVVIIPSPTDDDRFEIIQKDADGKEILWRCFLRRKRDGTIVELQK